MCDKDPSIIQFLSLTSTCCQYSFLNNKIMRSEKSLVTDTSDWNMASAFLQRIDQYVFDADQAARNNNIHERYRMYRIIISNVAPRLKDRIGENRINDLFSDLNDIRTLMKAAFLRPQGSSAQAQTEAVAQIMDRMDEWSDKLHISFFDGELIFTKKDKHDPIKEVKDEYA